MPHQLNRNRSVVHSPLTSVCWVHSNVYGLVNIHWIRYLTAVYPFNSTSSAVQTYHHLTSGSVELLLLIWCTISNPTGNLTGNPTSIGEKPVPWDEPISSIRRSTTSSLVSYAEQGIRTLTNVLQGHNTVVLVWYTSEYHTCMRRKRYVPMCLYVVTNINLVTE